MIFFAHTIFCGANSTFWEDFMLGYGKYMDSGEVSIEGRRVSSRQYNAYGVSIKDVVLGSDMVDRTGYNEGRYVTLEVSKRGDIVRAGIDILSQLLRGVDLSRLLVVGVGNPRMTTDRLGVSTVAKINVRGVRTLCPSVEGITGIPSIEIIDSVCMRIGISSVIAIDSLCARSIERLGNTYQFTNAGIVIGGGVGKGVELSHRTLSIPVVAIGVPTVISIRDLCGGGGDMIVTPLDIDTIIETTSSSIAQIIQGVL